MKSSARPRFAPDAAQQVEYLRLNRHVQRRDRLVADEQAWIDGKRSGNRHALALATRELVRVAIEVRCLEATSVNRRRAYSRRSPGAHRR